MQHQSASDIDRIVMVSGMQRTNSGGMEALFLDDFSPSAIYAQIVRTRTQPAFSLNDDVAASSDTIIERRNGLPQEPAQSEGSESAQAFREM